MRYFTIVTLLMCCFFTNSAIANNDKSNIDYIPVGDVPKSTMEEIKKTVDSHKNRIIKNFKVNNMPDVTVKVWQDRNQFEVKYGDDAEYVQGYVVQSAWEARFFNGRPDLGLGVVHEYTHLVTLALNPSFNNNPRWLWEATAIYESGRPPIPNISSLKCFSEESFPTIGSLEQHPFNIYKVGYFLADFIVSKWGQESFGVFQASCHH
ncbi:hypothetical protein ORJ04_22510 [Rheinheimera baltica]|uniref:Uncharacterized protein n=1 Tax=Rheinheimera baltica TaxID=67576 RepID=A0ABT9I6L8_9GAMM|nr:hypothetical protein [Rheinheimera baltica]MDP5138723.1 hypothetical protein [Rheinheimera baltica]